MERSSASILLRSSGVASLYQIGCVRLNVIRGRPPARRSINPGGSHEPPIWGEHLTFAIARPAVTLADLVDLYCDPGLIRSIVDSPSPRKARPALAGLSIRSVRSRRAA